MLPFILTVFLGFFASRGLASPVAIPTFGVSKVNTTAHHGLFTRSFDCSSLPSTINYDDCTHASDIGIHGLGFGTSNAWIGNNGQYTFNFHNSAGQDVMLILWDQAGNSFVSGITPAVTYSLNDGDYVSITMNSGVSGGFAGLYNRQTTLNNAGQVWNTWGEFSTSNGYPTYDVSREVNDGGNGIKMLGNNGCNAEWNVGAGFNQCAFRCSTIENSQYNSCGSAGTYWLDNCFGSDDPGATVNSDSTQGGCQGWSSVDVTFT